MHPITTLRLDTLLDRLRDDQRAILEQIDQDPLLKRRQNTEGLIIANAGPKLFQPEHEHQLFAKGIVYTPELKLASLPLVKMYNHGLRPLNDATTHEVEAMSDIRIVFPEKLDGTMLQLFAFNGQCFLTTRSMMEGLEGLEEDSIFLKLARQILQAQYPQLLRPEVIEGKSLIFELIHPKSRQITRYGARQDMVLLSVFDHQSYRYWAQHVVDEWAAEHRGATAQMLLRHEVLEDAIETIRDQLNDDPQLPEGTIVCFERGDVLIHRVKVKMATYLEHFSARLSVSYKTTVEILWNRKDLHNWPSFLDHLITEKMSEEEVELLYREFFDAFMVWYAEIATRHQAVVDAFDVWLTSNDPVPEGGEALRLYTKAFALWAKPTYPELFHLLMVRLRKGTLSLYQVMWHHPAYSGMRNLLEPVLYESQ